MVVYPTSHNNRPQQIARPWSRCRVASSAAAGCVGGVAQTRHGHGTLGRSAPALAILVLVSQGWEGAVGDFGIVFDFSTFNSFESSTSNMFESSTFNMFESSTSNMFESSTFNMFESSTSNMFESSTFNIVHEAIHRVAGLGSSAKWTDRPSSSHEAPTARLPTYLQATATFLHRLASTSAATAIFCRLLSAVCVCVRDSAGHRVSASSVVLLVTDAGHGSEQHVLLARPRSVPCSNNTCS
ncbi:hypothetical protein PMIN01_00732 [Paraphaeosphaeria minitans]|uniref:Uncharacterized protein n=1 Tax=Paraphaeosphaeria minitans TaxID=565426 RepID=A0A9P6GTX7_9PLEO|nr:hypothetical protein PMIN01_00732 [Paraphaeosphaeria minitans]